MRLFVRQHVGLGPPEPAAWRPGARRGTACPPYGSRQPGRTPRDRCRCWPPADSPLRAVGPPDRAAGPARASQAPAIACRTQARHGSSHISSLRGAAGRKGRSVTTPVAKRIKQVTSRMGSRSFPRQQDGFAWPRWCHRRIFASWWEEKAGDKVRELGRASSTSRSACCNPHLERPGPLGGYAAFDLCRQTACSSPPLSCPRSAAASSYTARNWSYGSSGTPASTAKARRCTSTATCERPTRLPM